MADKVKRDRVKKGEVQGAVETKVCATCGRTMEWRKSWAKNWDEVKYCSDRCRSAKPKEKDRELEAVILRLLAERGAGKTICASEAARAMVGAEEGAAWEPWMQTVRAAARRLVAEGRIVITQGGRVVDGSTAKGPIRLRLR
jgi:hypothetical protein